MNSTGACVKSLFYSESLKAMKFPNQQYLSDQAVAMCNACQSYLPSLKFVNGKLAPNQSPATEDQQAAADKVFFIFCLVAMIGMSF